MGSKNPKPPAVPEIQAKSLGQIQDEAVSSTINNLPRLLEAFQQFGPEFSKVLTDNFVQAQNRAPEAYPELYSVLKPLSQLVSSRIKDASSGSIPQGVLQPYQTLLRQAQAKRGFAESPVSASQEAQYLLPYAENWRSGVIDEGQNLVGTLNTLRTVPGGETSLSDLGLTPPTIGGQMQLEGEVLQPFRESARLNNYSNNLAYQQSIQKRNKGTAGTIGAVAGGVLAPFAGIDQLSGAQIGQASTQAFF